MPLTARRLDPHRLVLRREEERVVDEVGDGALEQRRVDVDPRQRLGNVDLDSLRRHVQTDDRARDDLLDADRLRRDRDAAGLQPAHVEQVADERVEPLGFVVDRLQQLLAAAGSQSISSLSRLVAAARIDASGVRRSWLTAASRAVRSSFAFASAVALAASACNRRPCSAKASWVANALSTSRSRARSSVPDHARIEPSAKANDSSADSGSRGGFRPRGRLGVPAVAGTAEDGHAVELEARRQLLRQLRQRLGILEHGACHRRQRPRFGLRSHGVVASPRRQIDERADDARDDEEAHERQDVTRVRDRERVDGRREVPVQQQEGHRSTPPFRGSHRRSSRSPRRTGGRGATRSGRRASHGCS